MTPEEMFKQIKKDPIWLEAEKQIAEQEEVKRVGYRLDDYCWICKKFFRKLNWKLCPNGFITYYCDKCFDTNR